jgi:hypothetical protein
MLDKLPYLLPHFNVHRPKMSDSASSHVSSPSISSDDEEYSSLPISKREYLLAQLKQKDAIIESLLKQVRLSRVPSAHPRPELTMIGDPRPSCQLHNPYLATPLSIEAYRTATSSGDHHRQNVIAWLDRLQSSVRSPPERSITKNPFQSEASASKGNTRERGGESEESDEDQTPQQQHAPPPRSSSDSEDTPVSPNTLVDSDIDPYPDDAVPISLIAKLAISTLKDSAGQPAERTRGDNANADSDDVVRAYYHFSRKERNS